MTGDQVLDAGGAKLFLDSAAAELLDDKSLDASVEEDGRVMFSIAEQPV
jgi:iron-sulfur cluster assembly protein